MLSVPLIWSIKRRRAKQPEQLHLDPTYTLNEVVDRINRGIEHRVPIALVPTSGVVREIDPKDYVGIAVYEQHAPEEV